MNTVHLHLILNHIPVIGVFFGLFLWVTAAVRKNEALKKISLIWFVIIAVLAVPVYLTGESAEEFIERLPWGSESLLEQHEGSAFVAFVSIGLLGIISLGRLVLFRKAGNTSKWLFWSILVFALVTAGLITHASSTGGQIRHTEIYPDSQLSIPKNNAPDVKGHRHYNNEFYGTVESMPKDGYEGIWVINGREILVTRDTFIKEKHGKVKAGVFVEVEGSFTGKTITAHEIEVKKNR